MEKQISTGLKIWLWFVIIMHGLGAISNLTSIEQNPLRSIICILLYAAMIYSCVLIMFQTKKLGFKLMCIASGGNALYSIASVILALVFIAENVASGIVAGLVGAVSVAAMAAICPLITYFLIKSQWDMFE